MAEFGGHPFYSCRNCLNPLAFQDDLLSKAFKLIEQWKEHLQPCWGEREEKQLIFGVYTIANIHCSKFCQEMGWHYLRARDLKNRFKEGNFII
ncbi:hypothetical protein ACOSP7_031275 [Xanthoceras sorbifolium]